MFAAGQADAACVAQFPDLSQAFADLKRRFTESPMEILVTHPRTGVAEPMLFNDEALAGSLRFLAYSPISQMMIPYLVHEAATTGNPERLAMQAMIQGEQITDAISIGLNFAVGCSEDWPHWPQDRDASGTLMGNAMRDLYAQVCAWWPVTPVDASFHEPFDVDVPVLILSGEFDPVTPPEYGDEAAAQFSNSLHLIATGRGHIVAGNPCISAIATDFIASADLAALDTECMDTIGPEPFFLNLLGPSP
ncbi:MAG: alpha/beta hydrolase [Pseudomonadota bacterium]